MHQPTYIMLHHWKHLTTDLRPPGHAQLDNSNNNGEESKDGYCNNDNKELP